MHDATETSAELFLRQLYPGNSELMVDLRTELLDAVESPGLTTVLLLGSPGSGKTTMGRALAMGRMLDRIEQEQHRRTLEMALSEVRKAKPLTWYRDISLAGLSDTLAESQLFGLGKGVASSAMPRIGIFEQAMTGIIDQTKADKKHTDLIKEMQKEPIPSALGGVVLLDEIGDLPEKLQPKLLRTLNGERQYRVGMEGNDDFSFVFRGLVIAATWKDIDRDIQLRDDLKQRICQYRINVPSLSDYPEEARVQVVKSLIDHLRREYLDDLTESSLINDRGPESSSIIAPRWQQRLELRSKTTITEKRILDLARLDWSRLAEFRGLRRVLHSMLGGLSIAEALDRAEKGLGSATERTSSPAGTISTTRRADAKPDDDRTGLDHIRKYIKAGVSVSSAWMQERAKWIDQVLALLNGDSWELLKMLQEHGKSPTKFRKELENMKRSKRR